MLYRANLVKNYDLNCIDGEIGKVKDIYFDDKNWSIRYLIVDTGNWLTGNQVLISPHSIVSVNQEKQYITINLTKTQIEESPLLENDLPVSKQYEKDLYRYFAYPMYSGALDYGGVVSGIPYEPAEKDEEEVQKSTEAEQSWDPNLRSTQNVSSYHIQYLDDKIGHIEDFIIDVISWDIKYIVVATKNWLPGKKILISPTWIDHISWTESVVFVNLSAEEITISPPFTDDTLLDEAFLISINNHYAHSAYFLDKSENKDTTKPI